MPAEDENAKNRERANSTESTKSEGKEFTVIKPKSQSYQIDYFFEYPNRIILINKRRGYKRENSTHDRLLKKNTLRKLYFNS